MLTSQGTLFKIFVLFILISSSLSSPIRVKRWSSPHQQLHRRRRNELLYSKYNKLIDELLKNNPNLRVTPIALRADKSELSVILKILESVSSLAAQLHQSISPRQHQHFLSSRSNSIQSRLAQKAKSWNQGVKIQIRHSGAAPKIHNKNRFYITKAEYNKLQKKLKNFCKTLTNHLEQISSGLRITSCS